MRVGLPREINNHEYRVGLTPHSVAELRAHGHEDGNPGGRGVLLGGGEEVLALL